MALTKVTGKGITCSAVTEDKLGTSSVTTNKIGPDAVTSAKINNGSVTADDLASTLDLSSKTVTLASSLVSDLKRPVQDNIALLGFKMAVNDGLTVFNLVDGVVDEFNDESGTDEAEGSNDLYCASGDFYQNLSVTPGCFSAGFSTTAITEPDTSVTGTNPAHGCGTNGSFTVPCGMTSASIKIFGAGAASGGTPGNPTIGYGGGGGFVSGTLGVSGGQILDVYVGEGGVGGPSGSSARALFGGGAKHYDQNGGGGGIGLVSTQELDITPRCAPSLTPSIAFVAGAGGGGGGGYGSGGGGGGGLTGCAGESQSEQTASSNAQTGGGGDQEQGGQGGPATQAGANGAFLQGGGGGSQGSSGGGAGFYGGGSGGAGGQPHGGAGGGGSSYYGHPQVTCGYTEEAEGPEAGGNSNECGAKAADPDWSPAYSEGYPSGTYGAGKDGYVLITGTGCIPAPGGSSTIVSTAFTSSTVATSARIVVFQEDVDSPTLNTDIIASVSRDGTNFTNATLTDSGYVTGSSGQRILTGQADVSGQPSGQSMRWKLALANNTVKIHGVALQWS